MKEELTDLQNQTIDFLKKKYNIDEFTVELIKRMLSATFVAGEANMSRLVAEDLSKYIKNEKKN